MPNFTGLNTQNGAILWQDAVLSIGIPDMKGINENVTIKWNDRELKAEPGAPIDFTSANRYNTRGEQAKYQPPRAVKIRYQIARIRGRIPKNNAFN